MNLPHLHPAAIRILALAALLGSGMLPSVARAATYTWDGGGAHDDWGDRLNWSTDASPVSSADTAIVFAGATRLTPNQNIANPFLLNALSFDSTAGAFVLGGGALEFRTNSVNALPTVTQNSANAQTINNNLTLTDGLTINGTGTGSLTLGGAISGTGSLTKIGGNSLVVTGTGTYTGGTNVNAGTLVESNTGAAFASGSTATVAAGATLALSNTTTNTVTQNAVTFTGAGTLQKLGAGTVTLGGQGNVNVNLAQGGVIDVEAGTLNGSSTFQSSYTNNRGNLNIAAGATFNGVEGNIRVDALTGAGTLLGGYYNLNTSLNQGSTTIGVAGGSGTFSGVVGDNPISGASLSLTKEGTGTQILTGTNTYTGVTTISAGTLQIGNGGTGGTLGTGAVTDNAALVFNRSDSVTVANAISGSGGVTKLGSSALTYTGTSTATGDTTVGNGSLLVTTGSFSGGRNFTVEGTTASPASVTLGTAGSISSQAITVGMDGRGTLTQNGGTLTTASNNALGIANNAGSTGTYNLNGGTLNAGYVGVGGAGNGTFVQAGGSVTASQEGYIGSSSGGVGKWTQSAGSTTIAASFYLGYSSGSTGMYNLSGGTLSVGAAFVGRDGTGVFNQSGGSFSTNTGFFPTFFVGSASGTGTYNLSGTGSLSTGEASIGTNGTATFNQSGGSFTTNGHALRVADTLAGAYNLSGGTLSTGSAFVGRAGNATFNQSGGSFDTNGNTLFLGSGGDSTYTLSGTGSLITDRTQVSNGGNTSSFTQTGGTHTTGTLGIAGTANSRGIYTLSGGTLNAGSVINHDPGTDAVGTSIFNFNGGTLRASGSTTTFLQGLTTVNVQAGGAKIDTKANNVTVAQNLLHDTAGGAAAADGGLTKLGSGTLTLTGSNTFNGPLTLSAGVLRVSSEVNLGGLDSSLTVLGGGELQFTGSATLVRTYNLGVSTLSVSSGQTLTFGNGAFVSGGFLGTSGTYAMGNGSMLNAVTVQVGSKLVQADGAAATLNNAIVRGTLNQTSGTLAMNNSTGTTSSQITVGGTVNTTGTELDGTTTINANGTLGTSGTSLYLGGGSRTTIKAGGMLSAASGTSIELNGGLLTNNGNQSGTLNVNYGATLKGSGTFDTVNVSDGGKFSPGNSPGTATVGSLNLQSAGSYQFELNSATTANNDPGNGADLINVTGTLTISAGTTANSRFTVSVVSLDGNDNPAALSDFDSSQSYRFVLVTASVINGYNSGEFVVNTSGFANSLNGGSFSVVQDGNNIDLIFIPVPEPSTGLMVSLALGAMMILRRRRVEA